MMDTGGTWLPEVGPALRCVTCATHDKCHCMMLLLTHPLMLLPNLEDLGMHQDNHEPNLNLMT